MKGDCRRLEALSLSGLVAFSNTIRPHFSKPLCSLWLKRI